MPLRKVRSNGAFCSDGSMGSANRYHSQPFGGNRMAVMPLSEQGMGNLLDMERKPNHRVSRLVVNRSVYDNFKTLFNLTNAQMDKMFIASDYIEVN